MSEQSTHFGRTNVYFCRPLGGFLLGMISSLQIFNSGEMHISNHLGYFKWQSIEKQSEKVSETPGWNTLNNFLIAYYCYNLP